MGALIEALATEIPSERMRLSTPIKAVARTDNGVMATAQGGQTIHAQQVVLALPPRIATQIVFSPALPDRTVNAMMAIATWMAGQAKALAVYDRPFWRTAGLSGDAMSRLGPLVEIHDASPAEGGPYALFGFVGVPPRARLDEARLCQQIQAQLIRIFGPDAAHPRSLRVKDWAYDPFTSIEQDLQPLYSHPQYGTPHALHQVWDNHLIYSGTEVASQFGGYIEGALEAAENALALVEKEKV